MSSRAGQSTKLQDRLKFKEIKNVENISPALSAKHPKQKEELVKFMSNVPSYLEKGQNRKEKALNIGVLDFRRLEKWQSNHKTTSRQSSRHTPTTSNSSLFSTDESSTHSSGGHSSSPARQRMHGPSLQCYLNSSPKEAYYQGAKFARPENVGKFEDLKASSSNPLKGQQNIFRMYQSFSRNQSGIKLKESKWKDTEPKIIPRVEKMSLDSKSYGAESRSKGKEKVQDGESTSGVEECQERYFDDNRSSHVRCKTMIFPRDDAECSHSAGKSRRSISEGSFPKEVYNAHCYAEFPRSCPLPCENDNINDWRRKQRNSIDAKSMKLSCIPSQPDICSAKTSISPSRRKKLEEKSNPMPRNSTDIKSSEGSDLKNGTVEAPKSRNPSPTRRLINGLGWIGRVSGSKDSSENVIAKHGSDKPVASSCLEDSGNDKSTGKGRSQSSPLRRLLDPLLKPKAPNSHQFVEPFEKDPSSVDRACKSSTVHPVKAKLDFSGCKTVVVDDSHGKRKQGPSTVQALLKIVIKNGLPLFTFAVDNSSEILAATMRKDEKCWIYTFFTVHELKKKNGWINRGGKDKSCGYVPNAVAKMTVSDSQFPNLEAENSGDELSIREFVLFSVDLNLEDQHKSDLHMNDELAAIVVKVPKETPDVESVSFVQSQELLSTTVILPGGVHGLPSKGEPSPLIKRWKLGGLCDCGGWDLGCRLTVLANQTKLGKGPNSEKTHSGADGFELFSQGEAVDDMPIFSLSSFKDGIFSVEFNSSLSFLQAFSICIAVFSCRKPYELSDLRKLFEEKSSENEGIKAANQAQPVVPVSYCPYPPVSPMGRV